MYVNRLSVEGFRCFGSVQEARLAPLTLLVGENSSGKTSFLAMLRALQAAATARKPVDFNEPPYKFGSYDEIAHRKGSRGGGPASSFTGRLEIPPLFSGSSVRPVFFSATFEKDGKDPLLIRRRHETSDYWLEESARPDLGGFEIKARDVRFRARLENLAGRLDSIQPKHFMDFVGSSLRDPSISLELRVHEGSTDTVHARWKEIREALHPAFMNCQLFGTLGTRLGAPVRSSPQRIYEAVPGRQTAEGDEVPRRLADVSAEGGGPWKKLQESLVEFGQSSGLFNQIHVRHLGRKDSDPFQIEVKKFGGKSRGTWMNLTDVGYGVSQALPFFVDIVSSPSRLFLLQQPEVHLHPQAQAAIGSLLLAAVSGRRQFIVETHSDHLLDRVRMDIRDKRANLSPEDVSLLYFERQGLEVHIHSLGIDQEGNVRGAPDSYRRFFLEETARDLGF